MNTVNSLQQRLNRTVSDTLGRFGNVGAIEAMNDEKTKIQKRFGSGVSNLPTEDKVLKALQQFIKSKNIADRKQAYLLCWGLVGTKIDDICYLENDDFKILLQKLISFKQEGSLSSLAWRGLINSYFSYARNFTSSVTGKNNWISLRTFLSDTFQGVYDSKRFKPEWLIVLNENKNLLEANPTKPYIDKVLEGDLDEINHIVDSLAIPQTSWFIGEIVLGQITSICEYDDLRFISKIQLGLNILDKYEVYRDQGLSKLLDRYANTQERSIEPKELSSFAQERWGNPKLARNLKWGQISDDTKSMVIKWLVSRDIKDFFNLFQEDGQADRRRMDFWLKYVDRIHDAYFSLGLIASSARDPDYLDVKKRNLGRISRLEAAGSSNNAFIMLIGDYVIVEFGQHGNACYAFKLDNLPFDLSSLRLQGNGSELKNKDYSFKDYSLESFPLSHQYTNTWGDWEYKFANELKKIGIIPDILDNTYRPNRNSYAVNTAKNNRFNQSLFDEFAEEYQLNIQDNRKVGGALWVTSTISDQQIIKHLENLGFRYKAGRGWHFSE